MTEVSQKRRPGRPKGAKNLGTKARDEIAKRAVAAALDEQRRIGGKLPIDVMLENMRFAYGEAMKVERTLHAMIENKMASELLDPEVKMELNDLMVKVIQMRTVAQSFATDVAPYVHPRLAAVAVKPVDAESDPLKALHNALNELDGTSRNLAKRIAESVQ